MKKKEGTNVIIKVKNDEISKEQVVKIILDAIKNDSSIRSAIRGCL